MDVVRIGILFSTQGAYGALGRDCRLGAELAVQHLQSEGNLPFRIEPVYGDPAGSLDRYMTLARGMMLENGCRHIFGTVTSQARKDVIPVIEKYDGQLWYVCPYEGFEANENVIYTGACPNQHLIPLLDVLLPRFGRRVYLAGANYVWGWEMNRLAREIVLERGGTITGERCLPIDETDVSRVLSDVEKQRPDFVLNNLIGSASHAFLRGMRALAERNPAFHPSRCPVVSCDLTECELAEIGIGVADGHMAAASYFDSLPHTDNVNFKADVARALGHNHRVSSFFATSYATLRLFADAAARCGSDDPRTIRAALHAKPIATILGQLQIDSATNHASLPFHLGRIAGEGFTILQSQPALAADPYLTSRSRHTSQLPLQAKLRVVS